MLVLGIDETTANEVFLHIDEVELNHTRHITVVLMVGGAVLGGQLQEHTRGECHLIIALTLVTVAGIVVSRLICIVGVFFLLNTGGVSVIVTEVYVAGHITQVVHQAIDTEVVAMKGIVARVAGSD